jgi:ribonuclease R
VHITDVAHFIDEGSCLDQEAYQRATSVYFPDAVYPMFPPLLSNGILSLNPREERLTLTVEMAFDSDGNKQSDLFYESVICSDERMTYTAVHEILEGKSDTLLTRYAECVPYFKEMKTLALLLRKKRLARGSLDFDLPAPDIVTDITGEVVDILKEGRTLAHQIIEEFMLAANEAVAEKMAPFPFVYRVHAAPDPERIFEFNELLRSFGLSLPTKERLSPKTLSAVLEQARDRPEEKLIHETLLRSMKKACYSETNRGHFGLASPIYTHFTSPVRRYPDLVVHRLLKRNLASKNKTEEQTPLEARLPEITRHCSARERVAIEAEREVIKRKTIRFMEGKIGETYTGRISGVTSFGFFVLLDSFFVEGLVHLKTLGNDNYVYDERHHRHTGRRTGQVFQLGDLVRIRVSSASLYDLELRFGLESQAPA